jgi:hypothetical protein
MKKITKLTSVVLASLLSVSTVFAADKNLINLSAEIDVIAAAGFEEITGTPGINEFTASALNDIDFGSVASGEKHDAQERNIFVKTNHPAGLSMSLSGVNDGALYNVESDTTIAMSYKFNDAAVSMDETFSLTDGVHVGSDSVGKLSFEPAQTTIDQAAGTYSAQLNVTIAAN